MPMDENVGNFIKILDIGTGRSDITKSATNKLADKSTLKGSNWTLGSH